MIQSLIGKKIDQTSGFLEDGRRVPLTLVAVAGNVVSQLKTTEKEGYNSIQMGFGDSKKINKPMKGHIKRAGLTSSPRFFREIRVDEAPDAEVGSSVAVAEVFEPGDLVDVTGTSKGKGFAGVVKKWNFAGGPRTHGQSDRERARGSSGSGTTPGRVYKGKKMAGRMGHEQVTVKNLEILGIDGDTLLVRGLVPGIKGSIVVVKKVGKNKKFTPLWSEKTTDDGLQTTEETEKVQTAEETVTTPEETVETASEVVETAPDEVKTAEETVKEGLESETAVEPAVSEPESSTEETKMEETSNETQTSEEVKGEENAS